MEEYQRLIADPAFVVKAHPVGGLPQVLNINMARAAHQSDRSCARHDHGRGHADHDRSALLWLLSTGIRRDPLVSGSWAYWEGVEDY